MSDTTDAAAALAEQNRQDALLMERMARGDREAFGELYDRLSRPLYTTALRILNDAREAEDVVQDVFLALWEKAADYEFLRGSPFSWAVTLTRNRAIDRIRMRQRRSDLLARSTPQDLGYASETDLADSADNLISSERAKHVRAALALLPAEQQEALKLAFFSGLTQQEIAEQLGEPLGTIKARIRRGLLKLRDAVALHA